MTLELGGKSPNIFFADVAEHDDDFLDKALEGFAMFALNQGEVCTCPSRVLVQESIYDKFMEKAVARTKKIKQGHPLDASTMIGAQASNDQLEKILSYLDIGKQEGAKVLTGGKRAKMEGELAEGYYVEPTIFEGHNKMRIFQEEIFGPVVSVTKFKNEEDALAIANDTLYGLGAGVWTRNGNRAYRFGRAIQAGRVWTNCYHAYPAHAAFGGYKESGIGRENHKMMLDHYQQTKNVLVSYSHQGARLLLIVRRLWREVRFIAPAPPFVCRNSIMVDRVEITPKAIGDPRTPQDPARRADVPPVRRLLRRFGADVLSGRGFPGRAAGRVPRQDRRLRVLYRRRAVRILAAHPAHHRRRARPRLGLFGRGAGRRAVSHPQPRLHR